MDELARAWRRSGSTLGTRVIAHLKRYRRLGSLLLVISCTSTEPKAPSAATPAPAKTNEQDLKDAASDPRITSQEQTTRGHSCADSQVFEGRVTVEGELHSTKGGQLMLSGALIEMPIPPGEEGLKRHAVNQHWLGKTVEIEGDRCVYYCEPDAQCLMSGSIPSLQDVKILKSDGKPVEP